MKIGYARVSTEEPSLSLQKQALRSAGCRDIVEDHGVSGAAVASHFSPVEAKQIRNRAMLGKHLRDSEGGAGDER